MVPPVQDRGPLVATAGSPRDQEDAAQEAKPVAAEGVFLTH